MQPLSIMVAVDFSEDSDHALEEAVRLATRMAARIVVVHVSSPRPSLPADMMSAEPIDGSDIERARESLKEIKHRVETYGLAVETHLAVGTVVYGLIDTIRDLKPDLVVVGSHGKGAIRRALLG